MIDSTTPYMYNMSPDVPTSMGQQPIGASGFSPIYPSTMNQQPPQSQPVQMPPSGGLNMPRYANGGSISSMANKLRSAGQRGDSILAHINPSEAGELQRTHGMDINPHTGLPQYGLYDSLSSGLGSLYDYGRDGLNSAGNYIEGVGRDIWKDYGHGAVDKGLGFLDSAISESLPYLGAAGGAMAGTPFGSPVMGAGAGEMFGQKLASKYNQSGGMNGYLMPKLSAYFGQGNPSGANMSQSGKFMHGLQEAAGNGIPSALGYVDNAISGALPGLGAAAGLDDDSGRILGQKLTSKYNQSGGIQGNFGNNLSSGINQISQGVKQQIPGMVDQARNFFTPSQSPMASRMPSMNQQAPASPMARMPSMGNQAPAQQPPAPQPQFATRASMLGMNDAMGNPVPQMRPPQPQYATRASMLGQSNPYQFAEGGHVGTLDKMAEKIRGYGEEGDNVLAHINPSEAMELDQKYGSDINPETGLPQFGKHRRKWGILGSLAALAAAPFTGGASLAMLPATMSGFDKNEKGPRFVPNAPSIADQMAANPIPTAKGIYTNDKGNLTIPKIKRKMKGYDPESYDYMGPEHDYFEDEYENKDNYAMGGPVDYEHGGYVNDSSDGKKDQVNARLSGGEYVWTAPEVAFFGGGNNEAGAKWLDKFRKQINVDSKFNPSHQGRMMDKLMKMAR